MAEVRKFSLGCPPEKLAKPEKQIWGCRKMSLTYVARGQTHRGQMARKVRGRNRNTAGKNGWKLTQGGDMGCQAERPGLTFPCRNQASVEYVEWNWQRALQGVAEEWEVRSINMSK
jgi:hypothetical protein